MNALLGVAIVAPFLTTTTWAMDNFAQLCLIATTANLNQEQSIKEYGLTPLMVAVCKGDLKEVDRLSNERSTSMYEKVQGLFPIHWAVIAKQDEVRQCLEDKDNFNLQLKTAHFNLTAFELQVRFDAWNKQRIEERESKDHYRDSVNWVK